MFSCTSIFIFLVLVCPTVFSSRPSKWTEADPAFEGLEHTAQPGRAISQQQTQTPLPIQRQLLQQQNQEAADAALATAAAVDSDPVWAASSWTPPEWSTGSQAVVPAAEGDCPGCMPGYCYAGMSPGTSRCTRCQGSLFVSRIDGKCGCPAGKYAPLDNPLSCKDCEKSYFCTGGNFTGTPGTPARTSCGVFGPGLTTFGLRSASKKMCVNDYGYSYNVDVVTSDPSAIPCPENTFGPGLRKQRGCVNCPSGYTTNGRSQQTSSRACAVAAGYYVVAPGRVAPCPRGSYKSAADANCTKCGVEGVTTPQEASTSVQNCTDLLPGFFASLMTAGVIKGTAKCPQGFYCPGGTAKQQIDPNNVPSGDATIVRCPKGMWTQGMASSVESHCLTPPGYYTTATATVQCGDGEYRPGWATASNATACKKCSSDGSVSSMATDVITVFKLDGTELSATVKATVMSCFILGGMGLLYDERTQTFKGKNCDTNNYGVTDITFGLNPANTCKDCPANMVTCKDAMACPISSSYYKRDNSNPPKGGFTAQEACTTKPGWGMVGKLVSPCAQGTYNPGDNYDPCTECGYGLTTSPNGTQITENDCLIAPGYGFVRRSIQPCPVGTYNDRIRTDNKTACTVCPMGSTNSVEGATSVDTCNMCLPGYGGDNCNVCGGEDANYGPGKRSIGEACKPCPVIDGQGFNFNYDGKTNYFQPRVISVVAATAETDCVGEFVQVVDGAWNLDVQLPNDWSQPVLSADTFADCIQLCQYDTGCQFVQYDYTKTEDNCQLKVQGSTIGNDVLAFKAVSASEMGATGKSKSAQAAAGSGDAKAKAVAASGKYTFWKDSSASRVGKQVDPPFGAPLSWETCLSACDEDNECAGVFMTIQALNIKPLACKLIFGDATTGVNKRAMIRTVADPDHMDLTTMFTTV